MFHCLDETLQRGIPAPQIWSVGNGVGSRGPYPSLPYRCELEMIFTRSRFCTIPTIPLLTVGKCRIVSEMWRKTSFKDALPEKSMKPCIKIWPLHRSALRGIFVGISSMFYAARDRVDWVPSGSNVELQIPCLIWGHLRRWRRDWGCEVFARKI